MSTFFIQQFGCRATQADAAAIERQLLDRGYTHSNDVAAADVVVINTCTVTASADLQARQAITAIHRDHPATKILVTGCYAQRAPGEVAALRGVAWVVGNSHQPEIPRLVDAMLAEQTSERGGTLSPAVASRSTVAGSGLARSGLVNIAPVDSSVVNSASLATPAHVSGDTAAGILTGDMTGERELLRASIDGGEAGHTRPVLKIQDGCDSRCAYCVIPEVRGRSRSLAPGRVISEIEQLVERGALEVVLSGIDLGSYGGDLQPRAGLGELLRRILGETRLQQLRVSSLEPTDVTDDLIAVFAADARMAPHFHLPLQSGADRVLAAMRRRYRAEHYARRVNLIREGLPEAAIGADVIAGFPGESEDDHRATLALLEQLPLTYLHVFSFSARAGTSAANMPNQVAPEVITRRARELRAAGEIKKSSFRAAQAGKAMRVLTLRRTGSDAGSPWTRAVSCNYLDMRVAGHWAANQFLDVRITGEQNKVLTAVAC